MPPMSWLRTAQLPKLEHCRPMPLPSTVIDASGLIVAPGFIDIHTHADIALLARPDHPPKVMQGVTTEVFTNCGLGIRADHRAGTRDTETVYCRTFRRRYGSRMELAHRCRIFSAV